MGLIFKITRTQAQKVLNSIPKGCTIRVKAGDLDKILAKPQPNKKPRG